MSYVSLQHNTRRVLTVLALLIITAEVLFLTGLWNPGGTEGSWLVLISQILLLAAMYVTGKEEGASAGAPKD